MHRLAEVSCAEVVYPESDGEPMADNSKQFVWIVVLYGNLAALFKDREDVFVSGNQNWFPSEGNTALFKAPDVYVVFGRPKGHRTSWKQWQENDIPLTVVFEILSPGNTVPEMAAKFEFYEDYGVEEYYIYNPDNNHLQIFVRQGQVLVRVRNLQEFTSPRLGIRFDVSGPEMQVLSPDGRPFLSFEELEAARLKEQHRADRAEQRADQVEVARLKEQQRADQAEAAHLKEQQRADQAEQRASRQGELMRRVLSQQATAEELQELQQLLAEHSPRS